MTDLSKMNSIINKLADEEFKFGENDCYIFTAKLVKEWHGKDYTKLHAVYSNDEEAKKYMELHGGIEELTKETLGYPIDPVACRNGDVVTAMVGDGIALGFVYNGYGLFKSKKKVFRLSLDDCSKGWRIN